jgi:hypothetical protein
MLIKQVHVNFRDSLNENKACDNLVLGGGGGGGGRRVLPKGNMESINCETMVVGVAVTLGSWQWASSTYYG